MCMGKNCRPTCCRNEHLGQVFFDLEKTTRQSVSTMIRDGIELYIKFKKTEENPPSATSGQAPSNRTPGTQGE